MKICWINCTTIFLKHFQFKLRCPLNRFYLHYSNKILSCRRSIRVPTITKYELKEIAFNLNLINLRNYSGSIVCNLFSPSNHWCGSSLRQGFSYYFPGSLLSDFWRGDSKGLAQGVEKVLCQEEDTYMIKFNVEIAQT